jgi:branched-chain amino acid transport system ATP-binding protein
MILQLKDIHLSFSNERKERFDLLSGVNVDVRRGKVTALVGGNGAGKTTLFNVISGFQDDYTGKVIFDGKDISSWQAYKVSRAGIGRLFQGRQLMAGLSILENMMIASDNHTGEFPFSYLFCPQKVRKEEKLKKEKAEYILEHLFGKDCKYLSMLDQDASSLSYGEQRMIAIARLLMSDNKLLLLDEPTAGVNPVYNRTIEEVIRRMVEEDSLTVLLIEHNMHFVRNVADFCAYLDDGVIEKFGLVSEVLDDKEVRNSYMGL